MVPQNIEAIPFFISCFLSLSLTLFVLILFMKFESLRTFEFKLVALLIFSDFIWEL